MWDTGRERGGGEGGREEMGEGGVEEMDLFHRVRKQSAVQMKQWKNGPCGTLGDREGGGMGREREGIRRRSNVYGMRKASTYILMILVFNFTSVYKSTVVALHEARAPHLYAR